MFKKNADVLPSPGDQTKLVKKLMPRFTEAEVMVFNDFRERITYESGQKNIVDASSQRTTSLLLTLVKHKKILRRSFVSSGWQSLKKFGSHPEGQLEKATWEPKKIELNRSGSLPTLKKHASVFYDWYDAIKHEAEVLFRRLTKELKGRDFQLNFFFHYDRCLFANSHEHTGSYEHPYTRLEYSAHSKSSRKTVSGLLMNFSETGDVAEYIERGLKLPFSKRIPETGLLRKAQLPAVLDPKVVTTLAQMLFEASKVYNSWPGHYSEVLPGSLELTDNPIPGMGQNSVPFDHEGTPTSRKLLISGRQSRMRIADLQSATAYSCRPTGNGFRRGMFVSHLADLTPVIQGNYLKIEPGATSITDVIKQHRTLVYIHNLTFPFDRFQQVLAGKAMVVLDGVYFKSGQPVSKVIIRSNIDRPLISSYPMSHGSLLDRQSLILKEGSYTYSGWFPFVFLPKLTIQDYGR